MICGGCKEDLLPSEIIICGKCEFIVNKHIDEVKKETGETLFGGPENFNMLLKEFVITIAEYQAMHRLDFSSTMAIFRVFLGCVENADEKHMILYGKILGENGINHDGTDLL